MRDVFSSKNILVMKLYQDFSEVPAIHDFLRLVCGFYCDGRLLIEDELISRDIFDWLIDYNGERDVCDQFLPNNLSFNEPDIVDAIYFDVDSRDKRKVFVVKEVDDVHFWMLASLFPMLASYFFIFSNNNNLDLMIVTRKLFFDSKDFYEYIFSSEVYFDWMLLSMVPDDDEYEEFIVLISADVSALHLIKDMCDSLGIDVFYGLNVFDFLDSFKLKSSDSPKTKREND